MAMTIFPRPVSPKNALADLKPLFAKDRPHRWPLLGLSATLTSLLLWGFYLDARPPKIPPQIIYVESWMVDRKDSDVIRQQKQDIAAYEAALEKKQQEFQNVADMVGIEWRKDEAQNKARRIAVIEAVQKRLDQRLAAALKREAAGRTGATHTVR